MLKTASILIITHRLKAVCGRAEIARRRNRTSHDSRAKSLGGRSRPQGHRALVSQLGFGLVGGNVEQGVKGDGPVQHLARVERVVGV